MFRVEIAKIRMERLGYPAISEREQNNEGVVKENEGSCVMAKIKQKKIKVFISHRLVLLTDTNVTSELLKFYTIKCV